MKKILLFLFLIASLIVSAKAYQVTTSISPPQSSSAIFENAAATIMLQMPITEIAQNDVGLFECDVSCLVSSENCQSVIPAIASVQCAVSFQVLANQNSARTSSGKSDCLLQATSPKCRAVILNDFSLRVINRNIAVKTQAKSPSCRYVSSLVV